MGFLNRKQAAGSRNDADRYIAIQENSGRTLSDNKKAEIRRNWHSKDHSVAKLAAHVQSSKKK